MWLVTQSHAGITSFLSVSLVDNVGLIELISTNFVKLFGCLISVGTENVLSSNPSLGNMVICIQDPTCVICIQADVLCYFLLNERVRVSRHS